MLVQNHYDDDIRVRRKAEVLVANGYSVDVIALRSQHTNATKYRLRGVTVYAVPLNKKRSSLLRYAFEYSAFFVFAFLRLTLLNRKRRYKIIDVNNLPDFLVFAAALAKRRGAQVVFDMHEITPEFYMSKFRIAENSRVVRLLKRVESASMRFADVVITINEPVRKLLLERGLAEAKSTVITNSVDEAMFVLREQPAAAAESRDGQDRFVMMYHGTLTSLYGLDIALEAFGLAQPQMPNAEFWILGSGSQRKALENQAKRLGLEKRVRFVGFLESDEIPEWIRQCDVGVLATRQDVFLDLSFSNKLTEYIVMRKPVISSRLKTIRWHFGEEALAFCEPENPQDFARQMIHLYNDHAARERFADRAFKEYQPIRWGVMRERYLELMNGLVAAQTPDERVPAPTSIGSFDYRKCQ